MGRRRLLGRTVVLGAANQCRHRLHVEGQLGHFGLLGAALGDLGLQLGHAAPRLHQLLALFTRLLRLATVIF